jgi:predicted RNase H-like HicB family nuclease
MAEVYALIHEQDGAYGISFPDFPGCFSGGDSAQEALTRGRDALTFHIAGMMQDGEAPPTLRSLDALRRDPEFLADAANAVVTLVHVDFPGRAVRVNISIDETLLDQIDRAARARGESRSGFLASAARSRLAG